MLQNCILNYHKQIKNLRMKIRLFLERACPVFKGLMCFTYKLIYLHHIHTTSIFTNYF